MSIDMFIRGAYLVSFSLLAFSSEWSPLEASSLTADVFWSEIFDADAFVWLTASVDAALVDVLEEDSDALLSSVQEGAFLSLVLVRPSSSTAAAPGTDIENLRKAIERLRDFFLSSALELCLRPLDRPWWDGDGGDESDEEDAVDVLVRLDLGCNPAHERTDVKESLL